MKIYIASSWKNQHGVEMLTALLRAQGHEVVSWVENNYGENNNRATKKNSFEEWMQTEESNQSFFFDTEGATTCDLFIYYAPAGKDAMAEMGAAWAKGIPIIGLMAKGEDAGLMHKMVTKWVGRYHDVLEEISNYKDTKNPYACFGREPHPMDFDTKEEFINRHNLWKNWNEKNV